MRLLTHVLLLVLLNAVLSAQSATERDAAAATRAKKVIASELDNRLPKVRLEFFLKYESAGMPVSWRVVECREEGGNLAASGPGQICVEADFDRTHNGTVMVVVSVADSTKSQAAPAFVRATVTDMGGSPRKIRRLGDLPMELRRPALKTPKDLPSGVDARVFPTSPTSSE